VIGRADGVAQDVVAIGRIDAVPTLLKVLCETTGMGFAAIARVTDDTWTACAVHDDIEFGLSPGSPVDAASLRYRMQGLISVPIVTADGGYFGNLFAVDPRSAKAPEPQTLAMFTRFAQLIALLLDTERKREHEREALLDARATGDLREQFIAILGHDLRNPLHAVFAGGDMLERKLTDPALLAIARRIKVNSRRMSLLIDDVLDFARGRLGGGIDVELQQVVDLDAGLTAVVRELQDVQPDRRILCDIRVTRPVHCDMRRLQQVVSNLLGNALTHGSQSSAIKLTVKDEFGELVLEVWNDGEPIPPEFLDRIFEPFWRHSPSGSRNGLGLGLYIASQIIRAHAGALTVSSTRAHGTLFTARLPLHAGASAETVRADRQEEAAPLLEESPAPLPLSQTMH